MNLISLYSESTNEGEMDCQAHDSFWKPIPLFLDQLNRDAITDQLHTQCILFFNELI